MRDRVYAIVPARGGSKGVKGKNIRPLGGYPLIAWSIAAARLCPLIDRVIVSTNSAEIANVADQFGGEVPFLRPEQFATDTSPDLDFVIHALDWLQDNEKTEPDYLVHLRPTTPLRDPNRLAEAIGMITNQPEATALRSGHALAKSPHKMLQVVENFFTGFFPDHPDKEYYNLPRQTFPVAYQPDGYVDILKSSFVRASTSLHGARMLAYITPFTVEVDRPEDFDHLEFILGREENPTHTFLKKNYPPLEI